MHTCKIQHWWSNIHSTKCWILLRAPQTTHFPLVKNHEFIWSVQENLAGKPWSCLSDISIKTVEGFILTQFLDNFWIPEVDKPCKTNRNKNHIKYRWLNPQTINHCRFELSLAVLPKTFFDNLVLNTIDWKWTVKKVEHEGSKIMVVQLIWLRVKSCAIMTVHFRNDCPVWLKNSSYSKCPFASSIVYMFGHLH